MINKPTKLKTLLCGICIALMFTCFSQNTQIDSLENQLLKTELADRDRVNILNTLSFQYHRSDIKIGISYANEALEIAQRIGYREGMGDAYHKLGVNYWEKGILDSSLLAYEEAIIIYDELELIEAGVRARMNKAIIFENRNELEAALDQYGKALELIERHDIQDMGAVVSFNTAIVYNKMGNWTAAIEQFFIMVDHARNVDNPAWEASAWQSIGNAYTNLKDSDNAAEAYSSALSVAIESGNKRHEAQALRGLGQINVRNKHYDSAANYFQRALTIQRDLERKIGIANILAALGQISYSQKRYSVAEDYQNQAMVLYQELNRNSAVANTFLHLGKIRLAMDDLNLAEINLKKGYEMLGTADPLPYKIAAAELLSELYDKKGDYAKAFENQKFYSVLKDSLLSDTKIKELGQLEAKYEFAQEKQKLIFDQETERLALEKEKEIIRTQLIAVAGGLLLLVISIGFIIKAYREKSKTNQKLQKLDQFKTRLFANINHDLRTPLTLMQGYIHRITSNADDYLSESTRESLGNISSNAQILSEMTNEIHDLILLEEGKLNLKYHEVEMNGLLNRQVLMFGSMAEMSDIKLTYESNTTEQLVHLDKPHFEKIFYNLLSNALKFTPKGGRIKVMLSIADSLAIITLSDTGKGIDEEDLPNIFDRFYQSPLNEFRSKEGFGIGLAVVKELVELHGGTIDVKSTLGSGTTFKIILPLNLDKRTIPMEEESTTETVKSLPTKKAKEHMIPTQGELPTVLVVDDHEEIRQYIIDLISEDYKIAEAANGKQALEVLEVTKVDLILTDLMMPWLDGFDLIEKLKESEALSDIPVMVVSARTTEEDKHRVLDAGVNEFISKPFDPVMLQKRIKNLITDKSKAKNTWETIVSDKILQSNVEGNILKKLNQVILDRISDSNLTIDIIADELSASRSKTIRLVKELTSQTPLEYIKTIRMDFVEHAIISKKVKNASEAAATIGMSNATQFSNQYRKHFGKNPFA